MKHERSFHVGCVLAVSAAIWACHFLEPVGFVGSLPSRSSPISGCRKASAIQMQSVFKCLAEAVELQVEQLDPSVVGTGVTYALPQQTAVEMDEMDATTNSDDQKHRSLEVELLEMGQLLLGTVSEIRDDLIVLDLGFRRPGRLHWTGIVNPGGRAADRVSQLQRFRVGDTTAVKVLKVGSRWVRVTMNNPEAFQRPHTNLKLGDTVSGCIVSQTHDLWLVNVGVGIVGAMFKDKAGLPMDDGIGRRVTLMVEDIEKHRFWLTPQRSTLVDSNLFLQTA
eukprot:CAMPEP_0197620270 /NCGR_PEP_ID=MMETSP1338-20131121/1126_1 /TAXON_ID=43686 ORGANISM="Pelagodinium beii, Strain RCC1491" /NCGR_SAMPLE_ID=MMETSP1338 /ASSEMBLY_ACC=CAM_ASM_000754 /LENGTH=278 /DNA_ID=CAMNT_0043189405 /DNA_START=46 /DNA_END=882 /DNA_ORIENTATION=-